MSSANGLVIDLEDWYHPELVRKHVPADPPIQIEEATSPLLDLLDQYGVKASFFVLGEVVKKSPSLIETIFKKGHEIACHGYSHQPLWEIGEEGFRKDMERFHSLVHRVLGPLKLKGFRAPTYSLNSRTKWTIKILVELGYQYDASICPVKLTPLYGLEGAPTKPYRISKEDLRREDPASPLIEFPMSVLEWMGLKIPISGGFFLRLIPLPILRWGLKKIRQDHPFLLYFHPWEGYLGTPRLNLTLKDRFITYYGIRSALKKLEACLKDFSFTRIDRLLGLEDLS